MLEASEKRERKLQGASLTTCDFVWISFRFVKITVIFNRKKDKRNKKGLFENQEIQQSRLVNEKNKMNWKKKRMNNLFTLRYESSELLLSRNFSWCFFKFQLFLDVSDTLLIFI